MATLREVLNEATGTKQVTLNELESKGVKFALIVTDDTSFWRDDIAEKAEKVFCYTLVDLTKPTNICSIQVDFPNEPLYTRVQNSDNFSEDELFEIETTCDDGYYSAYFYVTVVKTWDNIDHTFDELAEYLRCNPIW